MANHEEAYEYTPLQRPRREIRRGGRIVQEKSNGWIRLLTIEPYDPKAAPEKFPSSAVSTGPAPRKGKKAEVVVGAAIRNANRPIAELPNKVAGQLMCSIDTSPKDETHDYTALSWVWGESSLKSRTKTVEIRSNNGSVNEIRITPRLEDALKSVRDKTVRQVVWVDALCLNQRDQKEKEAEIQLMDVIYANAKLVSIWLGPSADESEFLPAFIKKIAKPEGFEDVLDNGDSFVKRWLALSALMRREWFTRRWCVQEVALAKEAELRFGPRSIVKWRDFADAVLMLEDWSEEVSRLLTRHHSQSVNARAWDHIELAAPGAQGLVAMLNHFFRKTESGELERLASIETLLTMLSSYDVSVPKDAVYAILKLGKDTWSMRELEDVKPNYGLTTLQVYREFVDKVFVQSKSLDIICIPWAPPTKDDEFDYILPSWIVPIDRRAYGKFDDFGNNYARNHADCLIGYLGRKTYNASGPMLADYPPGVWGSYDDRGNKLRLQVKGRVIGAIAEISAAAKDGQVPLDWLKMATKSIDERQKTGVSTPNPDEEEVSALAGPSGTVPRRRCSEGIHIPEPFWRTLVADRGPRGTGPPGWYRRTCQKAFTKTAAGQIAVRTDRDIHVTMTRPNAQMNRPYVQFLRRVQAATWNKKFMISWGGRFGLVPAEAKRLDSICLIYGCSVPVVMRPKGTYWQLIGECYVHGIMNGELLEKDPNFPSHPDTQGLETGKPPKIGNTVFQIV